MVSVRFVAIQQSGQGYRPKAKMQCTSLDLPCATHGQYTALCISRSAPPLKVTGSGYRISSKNGILFPKGYFYPKG